MEGQGSPWRLPVKQEPRSGTQHEPSPGNPRLQDGEDVNGYAHDDLTHDDLTHDDLTHDDLTHDDLTHDDLTHDDLRARRPVAWPDRVSPPSVCRGWDDQVLGRQALTRRAEHCASG